jgi:hypothetical protein
MDSESIHLCPDKGQVKSPTLQSPPTEIDQDPKAYQAARSRFDKSCSAGKKWPFGATAVPTFGIPGRHIPVYLQGGKINSG